MNTANEVAESAPRTTVHANMKRRSLVARMADRYAIDPDKLLPLLKATAFRQRADRQTGVVREVTNEELFALLIIADKYGLDPFTKEIYAYLDPKSGAIIAVVSVDGWIRLINSHTMHRSLQFVYSEETTTHKGKPVPVYMECAITRADRDGALVIREYFAEVCREVSFSTPWDTHPNRMLRHKTLIQCARVAYGFAGLHDEDEAQRIIDGESANVSAEPVPAGIARINASVKPQPALEHNPGETVPPVEVAAQDAELVAALERTDPGAELDALDATKTPEVSPAVEGFEPAEHVADSPVSFAFVSMKINDATTVDQLNEAADLVRSVHQPHQRRTLNTLAADKRATLAKGTE